MSESVLKKFGKYFLLDRIGEGGMAEIFRARLASKDGSGRLLVIKRIQAAYTHNAEFVSMFKSEVQVTMRFTHPNIVQLYEAGIEQSQHFIAMEYVDGKNLRQILNKLAHKQGRFPVSMICYLVEQAASGLHYAHTFKDRITGEPLNLVHRDVSPQNILVSYDGTVKVIDFGIAKAATNGEATRAGVIKGKLSYLSPEQVLGDKLDGRSDLFALGAVLWELLTGKKLFVAEGENEFAVLKMIESCNTYVKPPSTFNPEVPKELDQIVMQALNRDLKKRFQNGDEFARALRKLVAVKFPDFSSSDLSAHIKKLFHEQIVDDRKQLQQVNSKAEELIELGAQTGITHSKTMTPTADRDEHTRMSVSLGNKFDKSQVTSAEKVEVTGQPVKQIRVHTLPSSSPSLGQGVTSVNGATPPHRKNPYQAPSVVHPYESNESKSAGSKIAIAVVLGVVGFFGTQFYKSNFTNPAGLTKDQTVNELKNENLASGMQSVVPSGKTVKLNLKVYPEGNIDGTQLWINSKPVSIVDRNLMVHLGESLEVRVERTGFEAFRQEFAIQESDLSDDQSYPLDVKLVPMNYGKFTLDTVPQMADVRIVSIDQSGGRKVASVLTTPISGEKLPAGRYKAIIENKVLGMEKTIDFTIQEGRETHPPEVRLNIK